MLEIILAAALATSAAADWKNDVYCPLSAKQARALPLAPASTKALSRADAASRAERRFKKLDKNNDGKLTRDELPASDRGRKAMKRFDKNADGVIDKIELDNRVLSNFDKLDVDRNGTLTSDERGTRYSATPVDTTNDDGDENP